MGRAWGGGAERAVGRVGGHGGGGKGEGVALHAIHIWLNSLN